MWDRKRRDFDELFREIENMIDKMLKDMNIDTDKMGRPFVYGFSITHRPGEESEIREFGNLPPRIKAKTIDITERRPLVDVLDSEKQIHVVAEMPGVEKEDIGLDCTETTLEIRASHGDRKYAEHIELPGKVNPRSARATYKNGVLEIVFDRAGSAKTSIEIE